MSWYVNKLQGDLEAVVKGAGFNLLSVAFVHENEVNYLRLKINHENRSVTVDDCELVSRIAEKTLDRKNIIKFAYLLEVESPGVNCRKNGQSVIKIQEETNV